MKVDLMRHIPVHRHIALVICLLALGALGACGNGQAAPVRTITQQQQAGAVTIRLEAPEHPAVLTEQDVLVTLSDRGGAPIDGATVWLGMIMPTMQMSPNEPDAIAAGGGHYRARAIFTMVGEWEIEVHATIKGEEYVARFRAHTG